MSDDVKIYIEGVQVQEGDTAETLLARGPIEKTTVELEKAMPVVMQVVRRLCDRAKEGFEHLEHGPSEVSLEFSVTLGADGGIPWVAQVSSEGSITVGLVWTLQHDPA